MFLLVTVQNCDLFLALVSSVAAKPVSAILFISFR